jgi:DNA-binding transcriptional LysR family regulator
VTRTVLDFRRQYPQVAVDLLLSQRMPNLLEDQLDVSVVIARTLPDSAYVSQKIGSSHCVLAASPAYLERHPPPAIPEDLADHACVLLATVDYPSDEWQLASTAAHVTFRPLGPNFCVNDMEAMNLALREGAGIGLLAGFSAIEDLRNGTLVRVLPDYHTHSRNVFALYSSRQFVDAKIKRFVDALRNHVGGELGALARELNIETTDAA